MNKIKRVSTRQYFNHFVTNNPSIQEIIDFLKDRDVEGLDKLPLIKMLEETSSEVKKLDVWDFRCFDIEKYRKLLDATR